MIVLSNAQRGYPEGLHGRGDRDGMTHLCGSSVSSDRDAFSGGELGAFLTDVLTIAKRTMDG
jgi:hypothetical protein